MAYFDAALFCASCQIALCTDAMSMLESEQQQMHMNSYRECVRGAGEKAARIDERVMHSDIQVGMNDGKKKKYRAASITLHFLLSTS